MPEFVTIATYADSVAAHTGRGLLEAAGIPAFLRNEHLINASWSYSHLLGGVELVVAQEVADIAREVLTNGCPPDVLATAYKEEAGITDELPDEDRTCPQCGGPPKERKGNIMLSLILTGLFAVPVPVRRKGYRCPVCGYKWK